MNDQLSATPGDIPRLFDIAALRRHRARAAAGYAGFDFLKAEAAIRLADRLDLMRLKTVEAYDKRKAESIRSRLYRIERQKKYHKEMASYYRRRPHSSYIRDRGSRGALMHIHRVEENRRIIHSLCP